MADGTRCKGCDKGADLELNLCDKCLKANSSVLKDVNRFTSRFDEFINSINNEFVEMRKHLSNDIKILITDELKLCTAELDNLRRDVSKLTDKIQKVDLKKIENILEENNTDTKKWSDLFASQVDGLSKKVKTDVETVQKSIIDKFQENQHLEIRERSIIIYRLNESTKDGRDGGYLEDRNKVIQVFSKLSSNITKDADIKRLFRLGKKREGMRPILIEFVNKEAKNLIMENLFKIKSLEDGLNNIGIGHDLTKEQREECKKLVIEAKLRESKDSGEYKYRVRGSPANLRIVKIKRDT